MSSSHERRFNMEQLFDQSEVDERQAGALIEQVEAVRARRNAARTMMLFRMQRLLTPEQRTALARRVDHLP